MRRVFKTRTFSRSMKKAGLTDEALYAAVEEMSQGRVDADLGSDVVKKRVALPGQNHRGYENGGALVLPRWLQQE